MGTSGSSEAGTLVGAGLIIEDMITRLDSAT